MISFTSPSFITFNKEYSCKITSFDCWFALVLKYLTQNPNILDTTLDNCVYTKDEFPKLYGLNPSLQQSNTKFCCPQHDPLSNTPHIWISVNKPLFDVVCKVIDSNSNSPFPFCVNLYCGQKSFV